MTQKVMFKHDQRFTATGYEGVLVEIETKDKSRCSKEVDFAYGHPKNPISTEDLVAKFKDCVSHAIKAIPESATERVIQVIDELEKTEDVCSLTQILCP
jgi:2-methylcitrate dehydratase PrpD